MLKSVFDAIGNVESKRKYSDILLNYFEISIIEDLIELLLPFFELTELMSGTKYVTASMIQPAITRLLEILQIYKSKHENQIMEKLAVRMHDDLSDRSREYFKNPIITAATFLDPRYRMLRFIKDETERKATLKNVKAYIISTYMEKFKSTADVAAPLNDVAEKLEFI